MHAQTLVVAAAAAAAAAASSSNDSNGGSNPPPGPVPRLSATRVFACWSGCLFLDDTASACMT